MKVGDRLELVTERRLAQGGDGLARAPDGRVVFVRGAAPDERLSVEVTEVAKRHGRAKLLEVIAPGPDRVRSPCPYVDRCGGCPLLFLPPERAAALERAAGLATLERVGRVARESLDRALPVWTQAFPGARTRARFAVANGAVGFREARGHRVAEVDRCLALHPALERARRALEGTRGIGEVAAVTDGVRVSLRAAPGLALPPLPEGVHPDGRDLRVEDLAGSRTVRPELFDQASHAGNAALLGFLAERLPRGARAVELYAGSGNFTRLLAPRFEAVVAVEVHRPAAELGRRHTPAHVRWRVGEAGRQIRTLPAADLVLVDPPRAGLEPAVRRWLADRPPPELWYVSCDVATLARDARALGEAGLLPIVIAPFDLYPGTAHLEWVVGFRRTAPGRSTE